MRVCLKLIKISSLNEEEDTFIRWLKGLGEDIEANKEQIISAGMHLPVPMELDMQSRLRLPLGNLERIVFSDLLAQGQKPLKTMLKYGRLENPASCAGKLKHFNLLAITNNVVLPSKEAEDPRVQYFLGIRTEPY